MTRKKQKKKDREIETKETASMKERKAERKKWIKKEIMKAGSQGRKTGRKQRRKTQTIKEAGEGMKEN